MHKYRAAARQAAWYNDGDESPNYNPFRKTRYRPSQTVVTLFSATQSDEEIHKGEEAVLPDPGATHANQSPVRISTEDLEARRRLEKARADETRRRREAEEAHQPLEEELDDEEPPIKNRLIRNARQRPQPTGILWSSIFSELWQNLIDKGKLMTSRAHSVPRDAPVLEVPGRPMKFMVIEFAKQEDNIRGTRDQ